MGGGLELCVFPEQSTLSSSSPVPPEVSRGGGSGTVGGCPGCAVHPACLQPPATQLPPVSVRSQAAVTQQPSRCFYGVQPAAPCPKRVGGGV